MFWFILCLFITGVFGALAYYYKNEEDTNFKNNLEDNIARDNKYEEWKKERDREEKQHKELENIKNELKIKMGE